MRVIEPALAPLALAAREWEGGGGRRRDPGAAALSCDKFIFGLFCALASKVIN